MKKTLLSLLFFVIAFAFTRAQSATDFTVPPVVCYNGPSTIVFAALTQTAGASSYSWTVSGANGGTCTPNIEPSFPGTLSLEMHFRCCGVYTVTLIPNLGPPVSHTMTVVCPTSISVVASPSVICAGQSATLTASGASTYSWSSGQTGSVIVVTPTTSTCYSVTSGNQGCGNSSAAVCVNVSVPNNVSVFGPFLLCPGASATLTASGATSYTWQPGGFTGSSIAVTPSVSTCYTVYSTSACSGTNIPVTKCITVGQNGTITISGPNSICAGGSATLFASGAVNYTWQPGNLTGSVVVVSPTVATCYTVSSSALCSNNSAAKCVTIGNVINVSGQNSICAGDPVILTANGAAGYTWQPGGLTGPTVVVSPTVTTCYTVTGVSASSVCPGNPTPGNLCVFVRAKPVINTTNPGIFCAGQSGTLSASGASLYAWQPFNLNGPNIVITPTTSMCYTVVGTSSTGCSSSAGGCFTVLPRPSVTVNVNSSPICPGGSATLTASGAGSYLWSTGAVSSTIVVTPSVSTCYSVVGSNFGCNSFPTSACVIVQPSNIIVGGANSICGGSSATLTASGSAGYTWQPGNLTGSVVVVSPSVTTCYTVTGSSAGSCPAAPGVYCLNVGPGVAPVITTSNPGIFCAGQSGTLSASGANTYTWFPYGLPGANIVITPTTSMCYTVAGTSTTGCTGSAVGCFSVLPTPTITATSATICAGGSATLTASGANNNYTWMPGNYTGSTIVITPSVNTCFTVIGQNYGGCTGMGSACAIVQPAGGITISGASTICPGFIGFLYASGGSSYTWQPGNLSGNGISINPTVTTCYTLTGLDACSGGTSSAVRCVSVVTIPTIAISGPNSICPGSSATLIASGSTSGYTWQPGGSTGSVIVVTPSVSTCYTVKGTNYGCNGYNTATKCISVTPTIVVSGPNSICAGSSATLTASGSANYTWQPGGFMGSSIVVSPTATTCYTVTGSGNGQCVPSPAVKCIVVGSGSPVITTTSIPGYFCAGQTGSLIANGASTYTWYPYNLTGPSIAITPSVGMCYTVVGTSSAGCTGTAVNCFSVLPVPSITVTGTSYACAGDSLSLTASGANTYTWQPGNYTGATIHPMLNGNYCFTVTGTGYGCKGTAVKCVTIQPSNLGVIGPYSICSGASATLTGVNAISYTWQPGNLTGPSIVVSPTATTCYTLYGSNPFINCPITPTLHCINVNSGPSPTITTAASPNFLCAGQSTTLTASGASSYTWYPYNFTGSSIVITPSVGMCYTVVGTNTTGCSGSAINCYSVLPAPVITTSGNFPICPGQSATITASGANSYTWLPGGSTSPTIVVSPSVTTCYSVIGNSFGCTGSAVRCVTVQPAVIFVNGPSSICAGNTVTLTASGSANYTWQPGGLTGPSIVVSPTATTCYTVSGSNGGSCQAAPVVKCITVNAPPMVTVGGSSVVCQGSSVNLFAGGASTYTWLPGNITGSFITVTPSVSTCYTLVGTAANGCIGLGSRCISVGSSPSITINGGGVFCSGVSQTLTASGAASYTWLPLNVTGSAVVITPSISTCYTVVGSNGPGCTSSIVSCYSVFPTPIVAISGNSFVCSGSSATLTASGATSYTWSNGATGASIVVSPTATACYTVMGSNFGCTGIGYASRCVFVGPAPTIAVSGNSVICAGGSVMLTASGASNYTWSNGASGPTVVVSPSVTTCYTVTGSNPGCSSTGSAVKCVVVSSAPVISISGNSLVCAGNSLTLTASGASSYTWSNFATGPSIVLTPSTPACYSVTGSNGPGCTGTAVKCFSVIPSISLSVTPNQFVCQGAFVSLVASGASTYSWSNGSTSNAIFVSPFVSTVYAVTGNPGSCSQTKTVGVFVNPNPVVFATSSSSVICAGSSVTLTATGANSYTWNNIYAGSSIVVSPTVTTQYTVVGTNSVGCAGTMTLMQMVSPCTGIEAVSQKDGGMFVYPNPASDLITLQTEVSGTVNYFVFDMIGREIVKGSFIEKKDLDLSAYANGTYMIRLESASGTMYKKLIIEK